MDGAAAPGSQLEGPSVMARCAWLMLRGVESINAIAVMCGSRCRRHRGIGAAHHTHGVKYHLVISNQAFLPQIDHARSARSPRRCRCVASANRQDDQRCVGCRRPFGIACAGASEAVRALSSTRALCTTARHILGACIRPSCRKARLQALRAGATPRGCANAIVADAPRLHAVA